MTDNHAEQRRRIDATFDRYSRCLDWCGYLMICAGTFAIVSLGNLFVNGPDSGIFAFIGLGCLLGAGWLDHVSKKIRDEYQHLLNAYSDDIDAEFGKAVHQD